MNVWPAQLVAVKPKPLLVTLRFCWSMDGMFVSVAFRTPAGDRAVLVPKAAVQALGDRQVVFVAAKDEEGKFIQRTVRLGPPVGESYAVVSGLRPGDIVVTEGSFLLRAESTRNAPSS